MAESKEITSIYDAADVNAKWDSCLDLGVGRSVDSYATGAFAAFLFFHSPVTRRALIAFGAAVGIGSAYTECSQKFDAADSKQRRY